MKLKLVFLISVLVYLGFSVSVTLAQVNCNSIEPRSRRNIKLEIFAEDVGRLKDFSGKILWSSGGAFPHGIIEIYRLNSRLNVESLNNERVRNIVDSNALIGACTADEKGSFNITGFNDGFYLFIVGGDFREDREGGGLQHLLAEISHQNGKRKKLKIRLR